MTGLDPDTDYIIEIATVITDSRLNTIAEGPVLAIHHEQDILDRMDDWNVRQHGRSGLLQRVKDSDISTRQAEQQTLEFLKQYLPANSSPMCGNTICQDRRFLYRHMRELEKYFHYRNLDVSTVKELIKRWTNGKDQFVKNASHLALDDIKDSIEELQYYRARFFNL